MPHRFHEIAFTDAVKAEQTDAGSRASYAGFETAPDRGDRINAPEKVFLNASRSFYIASVNSDGWPYIQHRGGPAGFVRVLNPQRIGFADFAGNRQYISKGNLTENDRVSLFFMDYTNKRRLKLFGRASYVSAEDAQALAVPGYQAEIERGMIIALEGVEWNCPQHIPERYDAVRRRGRGAGSPAPDGGQNRRVGGGIGRALTHLCQRFAQSKRRGKGHHAERGDLQDQDPRIGLQEIPFVFQAADLRDQRLVRGGEHLVIRCDLWPGGAQRCDRSRRVGVLCGEGEEFCRVKLGGILGHLPHIRAAQEKAEPLQGRRGLGDGNEQGQVRIAGRGG